MNHIHLETCPSTQDHLIALNDLSQNILVSTNLQLSGRGRRSNFWSSGPGSLTFSFTLKANDILTLTSAEVSILLCEYFNRGIKVKWPNDLLNSHGEKCGGIILQKVGDVLVIGVGLNLTFKPNSTFEYAVGSIFSEDDLFDPKTESQNIYNFILNNRLSPNQVKTRWVDFCAHLNKQVEVIEDKTITLGKFIGIGDQGQAMIETPFELKELYNGSLRIKN